jgi:hypothetical protein
LFIAIPACLINVEQISVINANSHKLNADNGYSKYNGAFSTVTMLNSESEEKLFISHNE